MFIILLWLKIISKHHSNTSAYNAKTAQNILLTHIPNKALIQLKQIPQRPTILKQTFPNVHKIKCQKHLATNL